MCLLSNLNLSNQSRENRKERRTKSKSKKASLGAWNIECKWHKGSHADIHERYLDLQIQTLIAHHHSPTHLNIFEVFDYMLFSSSQQKHISGKPNENWHHMYMCIELARNACTVPRTYLWKLVIDSISKFKSTSPWIPSWTSYNTAYFVNFICFTAAIKREDINWQLNFLF